MYLTETHVQVRDMAREFANDVIRPIAEELDREEKFPGICTVKIGRAHV